MAANQGHPGVVAPRAGEIEFFPRSNAQDPLSIVIARGGCPHKRVCEFGRVEAWCGITIYGISVAFGRLGLCV